MALEAILIKTPHTISFSNNPMPFFFALSPYGEAEKSNDIRLQLRVMLEKNYGSTVFEEIKNQTLLPNTEGAFSFDVRTLVDAYLQYYLPRTGQVEPVKTTGQVKKYKVQWSLLRNGISVGDTEESGELTVIKGGLAYDQWHSDEFFSKKVITDKQSLQFYPKGEKVFLDDAHFFFWLYNMPVGITYTQQVVVHVTHTGGSFDYTFSTTFNGGSTKAVYCLPAGWDQFPTALKTSLPAGEYVKSYWIDIQDTFSGDTLFKSGVYTIDYRNYYNSSTIIFRNSLGGLKTIRLRGQIDFEADYLQQQAQRVVPPSYYQNLTLLPQVLQVSAEESPKYKGDTGFMNQEQADQLRDLFLSGERYEVVNGRLIPIVVNAKNIKFFANRDNLISLQLEWQRAYINESYTPASLMPTTRSCPAMEFFQVKEVNKTTLQIMWSLMMPYDRVHVQLVYDSTTYNFYYDGNKGSVRQAITLPTGDMSITAKARTVCDEVAGTYGAYKTISVSYISNNLPVAVDDTFSINQGFGTSVTLNHSVLDNDYDPDGDAIAVIADSGSTHESGTYAIDAAGIITYTPPSTAFVGQDYFDYQVRETPSGTPVTARAYINVGAAVKVYAKMVMRNVSGTSYQTGEVWVDFFSDAAATTPLDVTSMGITVSVDDTTHSVDSSIPLDTTTTTTTTKAATGNKVRMYSGNLYIDNPPYYETHSFVLNAGTGYTVI